MTEKRVVKKQIPYDKRIFHVDIDSEKGDKIRIRFPVLSLIHI